MSYFAPLNSQDSLTLDNIREQFLGSPLQQFVHTLACVRAYLSKQPINELSHDADSAAV